MNFFYTIFNYIEPSLFRHLALLCMMIASMSFQLSAININIFCKMNGAGLERDGKILQEELTKLGHTVQIITISEDEMIIPEVDVNIFIEVPYYDYFPYAKKNYFIPNPEFYHYELELIPKFDLILCRTKEVERIFKSFTDKTFYLGFTSLDRYDPRYKKDFTKFLHVAGQSWEKGTRRLFQFWGQCPHFPILTAIQRYGISDPRLSNLIFFEMLPENELIQLQNECGIHLCPSETEGYGHCLNEGLSAGAIVITLNAPPMNEFVKNPNLLVSYSFSGKLYLANTYFFEFGSMEEKINYILNLPLEDLEKISKKNRSTFKKRKKIFIKKLKKIFM